MTGSGRAGAKVILLGEHAVVYGRPALVAGLPLGLTARATAGRGPRIAGDDDPRGRELVRAAAEALGLDPDGWVVAVESEIPAGRGLGSSAALAVATLRALAAAAGRAVAPAEELTLGRALERVFHGTPSGIDPAAAALGRCFRFVAGDPPAIEPLEVGAAVPLVIAWDDEPRSAGSAVGGLRARRDDDPARHETLFDAVAQVVAAGAAALTAGDLTALGRCFDENQALLRELGVSNATLDARVDAARRAGALGAKLTGAGAGGAIVALAPEAGRVADALGARGAHVLRATVV